MALLRHVFVLCLLCNAIFSSLYARESLKSFDDISEKVVDCQQTLDEIFACANAQDLPVLLVFLGKSWCPWSEKIKIEVLEDKLFQKSIEKVCVIAKVFIPKISDSVSNFSEIDKIIKHYNIKESPSFVLLSKDANVIKKEGFLPLDFKQYAEHWRECFSFFAKTSADLQDEMISLSEEYLESIHLKARELGLDQLQEVIMSKGLKVAKTPFFYLEKYESLAKDKKIKDPEMLSLKKKIKQLDPNNKSLSHLRLAMIDFTALQLHRKKGKKPRDTVKPLLQYVQEQGSKDVENIWKVEMMISQYLLSKGDYDAAEHFASLSLQHAPKHMETEVNQTLEYIRSSKKISGFQ